MVTMRDSRRVVSHNIWNKYVFSLLDQVKSLLKVYNASNNFGGKLPSPLNNNMEHEDVIHHLVVILEPSSPIALSLFLLE
jgi:hypothetical protein